MTTEDKNSSAVGRRLLLAGAAGAVVAGVAGVAGAAGVLPQAAAGNARQAYPPNWPELKPYGLADTREDLWPREDNSRILPLELRPRDEEPGRVWMRDTYVNCFVVDGKPLYVATGTTRAAGTAGPGPWNDGLFVWTAPSMDGPWKLADTTGIRPDAEKGKVWSPEFVGENRPGRTVVAPWQEHWEDDGEFGKRGDVWAPELHYFRDRWYLVACMGDHSKLVGTFMLVSEGGVAGPYRLIKGSLKKPFGDVVPGGPDFIEPGAYHHIDGGLYTEGDDAWLVLHNHVYAKFRDDMENIVPTTGLPRFQQKPYTPEPYLEGAYVFKHGGKYFLVHAAWDCTSKNTDGSTRHAYDPARQRSRAVPLRRGGRGRRPLRGPVLAALDRGRRGRAQQLLRGPRGRPVGDVLPQPGPRILGGPLAPRRLRSRGRRTPGVDRPRGQPPVCETPRPRVKPCARDDGTDLANIAALEVVQAQGDQLELAAFVGDVVAALEAESAHLHLDGAARDGEDCRELGHGMQPAVEVQVGLDVAGRLVLPVPDVDGVDRLPAVVGRQPQMDSARKGKCHQRKRFNSRPSPGVTRCTARRCRHSLIMRPLLLLARLRRAGEVLGRALSVGQERCHRVVRARVAAERIDTVPALVGGHHRGPASQCPPQLHGAGQGCPRGAFVLHHQYVRRAAVTDLHRRLDPVVRPVRAGLDDSGGPAQHRVLQPVDRGIALVVSDLAGPTRVTARHVEMTGQEVLRERRRGRQRLALVQCLPFLGQFGYQALDVEALERHPAEQGPVDAADRFGVQPLREFEELGGHLLRCGAQTVLGGAAAYAAKSGNRSSMPRLSKRKFTRS